MNRAAALLAFLCVGCFLSGQPLPAHWYDHAVIYEIYPRSFQDSNGDGIGDLNGITSRLDYLTQLGVDAVWITPFFPSPNADFGYDISNYTDVAPEYGTLADWDRLVSEAKKRGIRVLVDFVINHTSDQHPWFQEARSSRTNPKHDWYVWRDGGGPDHPPTHWTSIFGGYTWSWNPTTSEWYYHIFLAQQPDVNWRNPQLREAMFNVVRFWLNHGASGFRLDATPYLFEDPAFPEDPKPPKKGAPAALEPYNSGRPENHQVLRDLRKVIGDYPGDPVLLGESSTATIEDLAKVYGAHGDEIQLPMDFLFGNLTSLAAPLFKRQVDAAQLKLGRGTPVFFFSSHDHPRQWSTFGDGVHNDQIAKLTATVTLAQRGCTLLYYGEEIGMETMPAAKLKQFPISPKRPRADDRDGERTPMQWNGGINAGFSQGSPWLPVESGAEKYNVEKEKGNPDSIYAWYATLLKLRHENPAFRDGTYVPLGSGNLNVFAFGRKAPQGGLVMVVLNTSSKEQAVRIEGLPGKQAAFRKVLMASPPAPPPSLKFRIAPYGILMAATD